MIDPYIAMYLTDKTIELSPKIAQAAQGLWKKVKGKRPSSGSDSADLDGDIKSAPTDVSLDFPAISVENAVHDLQVEMLASADLINILAEQQANMTKLIEAGRLQFETLEKQNDLLVKRVESDSALIKGLESYNLRLVKDVEVERVRVNRLNSICIAIGVVAVAGLAMAVRLSLR
jgi:DNA-binding Xre family transcriptional regulator